MLDEYDDEKIRFSDDECFDGKKYRIKRCCDFADCSLFIRTYKVEFCSDSTLEKKLLLRLFGVDALSTQPNMLSKPPY